MARLSSLCLSLSDWEVVEAYQRWDGTRAGAMRLSGIYGVSYRTLQRAFRRMERIWKEMQGEREP